MPASRLIRILKSGLAISLSLGAFTSVLVISNASPASALTPTTLYVDGASTAAVTPGCTSQTDPCRTISQGVAAAELLSNSAVNLDVHSGTGTTTYDELVTINVPASDSLTIQGTGSSMPTIDDGGIGTNITIDGGSVTIAGLIITGGVAATGGGIAVDGDTDPVVVDNDTISGNKVGCSGCGSAGGGGDIYNNGGIVTVAASTMSGFCEIPAAGCGIDNNSGTLALNNSIVSNSTGQGCRGCAIYNGGNLTMTSSTISGNGSGGQIGGIGGIDNIGTLAMTDSTVSGNESGNAGRAGGIDSVGTLTVTSSTVSGNSSPKLPAALPTLEA